MNGVGLMMIAVSHPWSYARGRLFSARWLAGLLPLLAAAGCCPGAVLSFHVEPTNICAGERVTVTWDVHGKAALSATPIPNGWGGGSVPSTGSRTVALDSSTTFRVFAVDAKLAKGHAVGEGRVTVVSRVKAQMGASAACDSASKVYTGTFTFGADSARLRVASIESPTMVKAGTSGVRPICVTHAGQTVCVKPGLASKLDVPAAGQWTLSSTLSADEICTPPPQLRITFDFACRSAK